MGRPPCCDKVGIKKGPWTPEEDIILVSYIQEHGPGNWRSVPINTGLMRCSKSCRLRWTNYLRPGIRRGNFTPHEEGIIVHLQSLLGNRYTHAYPAHLSSIRPWRPCMVTDQPLYMYADGRPLRRTSRRGPTMTSRTTGTPTSRRSSRSTKPSAPSSRHLPPPNLPSYHYQPPPSPAMSISIMTSSAIPSPRTARYARPPAATQLRSPSSSPGDRCSPPPTVTAPRRTPPAWTTYPGCSTAS